MAAHAIVTNIQKRKLIKNQMDGDELNQESFAAEEKHIEQEERTLDQKARRLEHKKRTDKTTES